MVQKRFIGRISIFVFIMLFVFIACSKEGAHKFITSINEEGVEICVNSGGPKYSEPLYDIEETLSLGGEEEDHHPLPAGVVPVKPYLRCFLGVLRGGHGEGPWKRR